MIQWKTTWCSDSTIPMSSMAAWRLWWASVLSLPPEKPVNADGGQAVVVGPGDGLEDVRAVSRSRDRQQDVAGRGEVLELFEEDPVVAFVVGPGHDAGRVVGQAQDLEPLLVFEVAERALGQVFAEVRGVRARAAVADDEDKPAVVVGGFDQLADLLDLGRIELLDLAADDGQVFGNAEFCTEHQFGT